MYSLNVIAISRLWCCDPVFMWLSSSSGMLVSPTGFALTTEASSAGTSCNTETHLWRKQTWAAQSSTTQDCWTWVLRFNFLNHISAAVTSFPVSYCVKHVNCKFSFNPICLPSEGQRSLRTLTLRGCPEVDDWFLARLHMFQDSLEELDISHCPRITTGGLAALRHLK